MIELYIVEVNMMGSNLIQFLTSKEIPSDSSSINFLLNEIIKLIGNVNRLKDNGLFYIPEGTLPGEMIEVNDYDLKAKRRQITHQNTYFNNR